MENPYCYIKNADAVAVLSDHESWSIVITEAMILQTPVIATKTSGALEQIEDGITGILTEFDVMDIADKIELFLKDKNLQKKIKNNLKDFDNGNDIIESFDQLIADGVKYKEKYRSSKNNILYIIDDINYIGGAHIVIKLQIKELLKCGKNISIFSSSVPNLQVRMELTGVAFL